MDMTEDAALGATAGTCNETLNAAWNAHHPSHMLHPMPALNETLDVTSNATEDVINEIWSVTRYETWNSTRYAALYAIRDTAAEVTRISTAEILTGK